MCERFIVHCTINVKGKLCNAVITLTALEPYSTKPPPDLPKSLLEGVEFGMTDGATTCRCVSSQQEIEQWAGHIGKIDRHIAFELFRRHESEMYAAAARILDETPFLEMRMTAEDRWP